MFVPPFMQQGFTELLKIVTIDTGSYLSRGDFTDRVQKFAACVLSVWGGITYKDITTDNHFRICRGVFFCIL